MFAALAMDLFTGKSLRAACQWAMGAAVKQVVAGDSLKDAIGRFHQKYGETKNLTTGEAGVEFRQLMGRFIDVCQAIEFAHSRGVLHRDLKPGNIMLGKYGETLVVDWGLAKVTGRDEAHIRDGETTLRPPSAGSTTPTQLGAVIGTPEFMPPEQASGKLDQLGPASDVYSLGATLYCMLTGRPPFDKDDSGAMLHRIVAGEFAPPRSVQTHIPRALEAICLQAMALKPKDRYASAAELAGDVERYLADEPVAAFAEPLTVRAQRWMKKHQTLVGSTAAAVLVAMVTLSVLVAVVTSKNTSLETANTEIRPQSEEITAQNESMRKTNERLSAAKRRAEAETSRANHKADEAIANLKLADRRLYDTDMNLAQINWKSSNLGAVIDLLDRHRPRQDIESNQNDLRGFEWFYLDRQCQNNLLTLNGHLSEVLSVAFSPDGTRIASASADRTVKLWNVASGQEAVTLKGHTRPVRSLAFSPDGSRVASASYEFPSPGVSTFGVLKLWNVTTGEEAARMRGHKLDVTSVAFSPDGKQIASASWDRMVKLWDASTGQQTATLKGHSDGVSSVAFSPDGKRIASASYDRTVKLWNTTTLQEIGTLQGHRYSVQSVAFSPDGMKIASASYDQTVRIWDARPWTSESRIEQRALGVVRYLFETQKLTREEAVSRITRDDTITSEQRDRALEFAKRWKLRE